ncbi:MAG: hypothetical protein JSW39_05050 [Desulfobacterales bacterium]|nr:MAG: hypothetical protein JSW39_05050 [Desulfobacterales bacterium]
MPKSRFPVIMALLLVACAHGKTDHFPAGADPSNSAEVVVIRSDELFGWGFSLKVALDGTAIASLRSGDYIAFRVAPGFHTIGISEDNTLSLPLRQGQTYYLLISADYSAFGFELERIDEGKGRYWRNRTKPLE